MIRFASFLGDNGFEFYRQVAEYVGQASGLPTQMIADTSPGMEAMFGEGMIEAAFGCGLPYVWKAAEPQPTVRLVAAPVMPSPRYDNRPFYYADVIVRSDSRFQALEDLRGATFAYNQTVSFSGYVLPIYHWLTLGEKLQDFFGKTLETGSHARSLDAVEAGQADAAAIDSVVLDMEYLQRPERENAFRVLASCGPASIPPVIASARLDPMTHARVTDVLINMHADERGQAILKLGGVRRFAAVTDRDYDDIRRMVKAVEAGAIP
jgi:phosphonate transport system substrate-binding protein